MTSSSQPFQKGQNVAQNVKHHQTCSQSQTSAQPVMLQRCGKEPQLMRILRRSTGHRCGPRATGLKLLIGELQGIAIDTNGAADLAKLTRLRLEMMTAKQSNYSVQMCPVQSCGTQVGQCKWKILEGTYMC